MGRLSAADRARLYRERLKNDPVRFEAWKKKERDRHRRDYVPIAKRTPREQRHQRKKWREGSQKFRDRQVQQQNCPPTPPETPCTPRPDGRQIRGRRKVKRDRAKCYRTVKLLNYQLDTKHALMEKWKKRYYRERQSGKCPSTPESKTRKMLHKCRVTPYIRKQLVLHNSIIEQLSQKYKASRDNKVKAILRRTVANVHRKYRLMHSISKQMKVNQGLLSQDRGKPMTHQQKSRANKFFSESTKNKVISFLERDDNSRMMPGKKDSVTKNKLKKQKRLLNDTLLTLHSKFVYENPTLNLSYVTFTRLKPFWIVKPSLKDLDTCMCKKCTNISYMHQKLVTEKVLASANAYNELKNKVCSTRNPNCMYGQCSVCSKNTINFNLSQCNKEKLVTYQQWVTSSKPYGDGTQSAKITAKETIGPLSLCDLCTKYENELMPRFSTHQVNISHQYQELRNLKTKIKENEVIVHIDFSENYSCKHTEEIQSVHFGGSHTQVSLHTGMYYTEKKNTPFCTISGTNRHDPSGIWGHLTPILQKIRSENNEITSVHFISDGPTTQYRNKSNFWLASSVPRLLGYEEISWNFLEAGHGKGAPDGIGGVIKRTADNLVTTGKDIVSAQDLVQALQFKTNVHVELVTESDIKKYDADIPDDLQPVDGTMKIHQLLFPEPGIVDHRPLSCFCEIACVETTRNINLVKKKSTRTPSQTSSAQKNVKSTSIQDVPSKVTRSVEVLKDVPSTSNESPVVCDSCPVELPALTPENATIGTYCMVLYDGIPYPGQVMDIDNDSVEVKTMSRVGRNRYFWPAKDDIIWYNYDDVLCIIPEPIKVSSRQHMIDNEVSCQIAKLLGEE